MRIFVSGPGLVSMSPCFRIRVASFHVYFWVCLSVKIL